MVFAIDLPISFYLVFAKGSAVDQVTLLFIDLRLAAVCRLLQFSFRHIIHQCQLSRMLIFKKKLLFSFNWSLNNAAFIAGCSCCFLLRFSPLFPFVSYNFILGPTKQSNETVICLCIIYPHLYVPHRII